MFEGDDNTIIKNFSKSLTPKRSTLDDFNSPPPVKKCKSFPTPQGIKRKFPGPAGLLPENFNGLENDFKKEIPCSQSRFSVFQNDPWQEMLKDYRSFTEKFTIKWIKNKAILNQLNNQKAPFLAAIVHTIECIDGKVPTISVILRDLTGEIQGTIIHNLYEEYSNDLIIGSVIVLKQFSVLTTGLCLTITPKNLIAIYTKNEDETRIIKVQDFNLNIESPEKPPQTKKVQNEKRNKEEEKEIVLSCSQISVKTNIEDSKIWEDALEGVDADALFNDF